MKKNLKKLISAVVALALTVGSVAMAAPTFTDVADTAANATAINALAALEIVVGNNGEFKPNDNITRAEVATMIVAALNRSADAQGAMGTTKFPDVNVAGKGWATGYVNIGVQEGFISGYDNGNFGPDDNVTYAQIVSMLVRIAGYGEWAEYLGGWSSGYISVADDKGITKGVSSSADALVTRAQVAQMLYNTLVNVPIVDSTSMTRDVYGKLVPTLDIMNGQNGNKYKTLLNTKHNAYYVEGYVSQTNKTTPTSYKAGEVEFTIEITENYDDNTVRVQRGDTPVAVDVLAGKTDAENFLKTYAAAIIQIDEDGEATIKSFVPSGKNRTVTFNTNQIDATYDMSSSTGKYVSYYESKDASNPTDYDIADTFELYVNGVSVTASAANFATYVANNPSGKVTYTDIYSANQRTDGKYDKIDVTYYGTAQVAAVNAATGRITLSSKYNFGTTSYIVLDEEDEDLSWKIIYNGEEIEIDEILADDVISIAYNVNAGAANSKFFEIYVSRDTAEGKVTKKDVDTETVTIGGTAYEFVKGYATEQGNLAYAGEYTIYLDAFGRVYEYELKASSDKYAIAERLVYSNEAGAWKVTLYTAEGAVQSVALAKDFTDAQILGFAQAMYNNVGNSLAGKTYFPVSDLKAIQGRVVKYKIANSTGRISSLTFETADKAISSLTEFKENKAAIGTLKMSAATKVINAEEYNNSNEYEDLAVSNVSALIDGASYTAYGFNKIDNIYNFVVVTSSDMGGYTFEDNFAVILAQPTEEVDAEENTFYTVKAIYKGEEIVLSIRDDVNVNNGNDAIDDLRKGDVVVFKADADGMVEEIDTIISGANLGFAGGYTSFVDAAMDTATFAGNIDTVGANNWTTAWNVASDNTVDQTKEVTQILFGAVTATAKNAFTLASFVTDATVSYDSDNDGLYDATPAGKVTKIEISAEDVNALGTVLDIEVNNDTKVAVYNFNKSKNNLYADTAASISASVPAEYFEAEAGSTPAPIGEIIDWEIPGNKDMMTFALVKAVDGVATDVLVFLGVAY